LLALGCVITVIGASNAASSGKLKSCEYYLKACLPHYCLRDHGLSREKRSSLSGSPQHLRCFVKTELDYGAVDGRVSLESLALEEPPTLSPCPGFLASPVI
jgi:hypothetical protein